MTETEFWQVIARLDWSHTGDDEAVVAPAVKHLARLGPNAIRAFEGILSEKLFTLDTIEHARNIGEYAWRVGEHFSSDQFLYARCVVVANGPELYQQVLGCPESFPKDMEFEAILYIAASAWEKATRSNFEHVSPTSYETFANTRGWPDRIGRYT